MEHQQSAIRYRETDEIIEIDELMIPIVKDFWNRDINTYQCCQGDDEEYIDDEEYPEDYTEEMIREGEKMNHYPSIIKGRPWIICQNKNREYIENNYNVEILENEHMGCVVDEYIHYFLEVNDFLFVIFNDLNRKII